MARGCASIRSDEKAALEPVLGFRDVSRRPLTYIRSKRARNLASMSEDGKPNLINFQLENGVLHRSKLLDSADFAVGKKKITDHARARSEECEL